MRQAAVHRFTLLDPGDVSSLSASMANGTIDPHSIVAVIGKTHGNGLVNDYTRGYLALSLAILIGGATGVPPERSESASRLSFPAEWKASFRLTTPSSQSPECATAVARRAWRRRRLHARTSARAISVASGRSTYGGCGAVRRWRRR